MNSITSLCIYLKKYIGTLLSVPFRLACRDTEVVEMGEQKPPYVRLDFTDVDKLPNEFLKNCSDPFGSEVEDIEFTFQVFNQIEQHVGEGKVARIAGERVLIQYIEIYKEWREQGYGTATLLEIHHWSGCLHIVPVRVTLSATDFWNSVRQRIRPVIIDEQIGIYDASLLVKEIRKKLSQHA